ncbi:MAG: hypothetical protein K0B15_02800 [Lentimicrobium sp.]|nr:hypothetical protein [Lentimicrobium sp.]
MFNNLRIFSSFVLLAFLLNGFNAFAQTEKQFSEQPTVLIIEVEEFMKPATDKESRQAIQQFSSRWNSGEYEPAVQNSIRNALNIMMAQRMRPTPAFRDYLSALTSFEPRTESKNLLAWHKGLEPFLDAKNLRALSNFLANTANLNLSKVLFRSYANSWQFRNGNFSYYFDSILKVKLEKVDLVCISGRDSIRIFQTSGTHFPTLDKFAGNGGKVNWEVFGFDPDKVYVYPGNYEINLKQTAWSADTANFYHKDFFNLPLTGKFEDRVMAGVSLDRATTPKFTSYQNDLEIRQLFNGIDYKGGFTLEGSRIIGSGYGDQDALLWISYKGEPILKLASRSFVIRPDRISSQRSSATLYHQGDSIFHPGVQLRYLNQNRELMLNRSSEGASASPFYNSYHKLDMYFETLLYTLESDSMSFEMSKGIRQQGEAVFESSNFFSEGRYYRMQGIDDVNPINVIYNFVEKNGNNRKFYLSELVEYMKKPVAQSKAMVLNLANGGYLIYNIDNERIEVSDRLFDFLSAKSRKKDYDVIQINSRVNASKNASLNLETFDLIIKGVPEVSISDSQAVKIYPRDQEILVQKDLNFVFTGKVKAGYFDFYANKSSFEYDRFQLSMPQIDSISFKVDTVSKRTKKIDQVLVKNVLANLSGDLLIDAPDNKSGTKLLPQYPIFISKNDAFVFYDYPSIEKGAYSRDKFYYVIYPFQLDSLNNFTTEGLKFNGHLFSDGLMPDIAEPLRVMKDYSLGFTRKLKPEGIPVYNDKAVFYSDLSLSNKGLEGSGSLKFMTSISESKRFLFTPDSLVADLSSIKMKEQSGPLSFPEMEVEDVHQYWMPDLDIMRLQSIPGKEFAMYNNKSLHSGTLFLTSAGLLGNGISKLDNADIASGTFIFSNQSFETDTASFRLYYPERPNLSLSVKIYPGRVDFRNNIANFGTPGVSTKIDLPLSRYISYMDKIEWRMQDEELFLTNSLARRAALADTTSLTELVDFDFSGSEFMSTNPKMDSLQFFAMEATYRMKENIINAREVKMIRVGDAAVFPGDGHVTILSDGVMKPLKNATLIANRKSKAYRIYNADITIKSRKDYLAAGYYDYTDDLGNVQPLYFKTLSMNNAGNTNGMARIPGNDPFALSSHFDFTGDIYMDASRPLLTFTGNYRPKSDCFDAKGPRVSFSAQLDPSNIRLPVSPIMRDTLGDPVLVAIVYSDFFSRIYPAIYSKPKAWGDTLVASASGFISFDRNSESFLLGTESQLDKKNTEGNFMTIDTRQCIITSSGEIETGVGLGLVKLRSFGKATHYSVVDSTKFNLALALNFFFSDPALGKLRESLLKAELQGTNVNSESYHSLLTGLAGARQAEEILNELNTTGNLRRPPVELVQSIILTDVEMRWDENLKSFVSKGQLGIAGILRDQVNRKVNGYIEIGKRRTGDILNLYIEISNTEWYFFTYGNGIMQAISSNNDFNNILAGLKEDKRRLKAQGSGEEYQFIISTPERRIAFLRKMQSRESN